MEKTASGKFVAKTEPSRKKLARQPSEAEMDEDMAKRIQTSLQAAFKKDTLIHSTRNVAAFFKKYDKDKNDRLSTEELKKLLRVELRMSEETLTDKDVESLLAALDDDNDGSLSIDELVDFIEFRVQLFGFGKIKHKKKLEEDDGNRIHAALAAGLNSKHAEFLSHNEKEAKLLAKFHNDKSGVFSIEELTDLVRRELQLHSATIADKDITSLFAMLDKDNTETLSIAELTDFVENGQKPEYMKTHYKMRPPPPPPPAESKWANKEYGADVKPIKHKRRKLLMEQALRIHALFSTALSTMHGGGAKDILDMDKVKKLFAKMDKDRDGMLSAEELKKFVRVELHMRLDDCPDRDVDSLFNSLDDDNSQQVSPEELIEFLEHGGTNAEYIRKKFIVTKDDDPEGRTTAARIAKLNASQDPASPIKSDPTKTKSGGNQKPKEYGEFKLNHAPAHRPDWAEPSLQLPSIIARDDVELMLQNIVHRVTVDCAAICVKQLEILKNDCEGVVEKVKALARKEIDESRLQVHEAEKAVNLALRDNAKEALEKIKKSLEWRDAAQPLAVHAVHSPRSPQSPSSWRRAVGEEQRKTLEEFGPSALEKKTLEDMKICTAPQKDRAGNEILGGGICGAAFGTDAICQKCGSRRNDDQLQLNVTAKESLLLVKQKMDLQKSNISHTFDFFPLGIDEMEISEFMTHVKLLMHEAGAMPRDDDIANILMVFISISGMEVSKKEINRVFHHMIGTRETVLKNSKKPKKKKKAKVSAAVIEKLIAKLNSAAYTVGGSQIDDAFFSRIDASGDGMLDLEEFVGCVRSVFRMSRYDISDGDCEDLWRTLDAEDKGQVSCEDLISLAKGTTPNCTNKKLVVMLEDGRRARDIRQKAGMSRGAYMANPVYDDVLCIGTKVKVTGLIARCDLNGQEGLIVEFNEHSWRYKVIMNDESLMVFTPNHLKEVRKPSMRSKTPEPTPIPEQRNPSPRHGSQSRRVSKEKWDGSQSRAISPTETSPPGMPSGKPAQRKLTNLQLTGHQNQPNGHTGGKVEQQESAPAKPEATPQQQSESPDSPGSPGLELESSFRI